MKDASQNQVCQESALKLSRGHEQEGVWLKEPVRHGRIDEGSCVPCKETVRYRYNYSKDRYLIVEFTKLQNGERSLEVSSGPRGIVDPKPMPEGLAALAKTIPHSKISTKSVGVAYNYTLVGLYEGAAEELKRLAGEREKCAEEEEGTGSGMEEEEKEFAKDVETVLKKGAKFSFGAEEVMKAIDKFAPLPDAMEKWLAGTFGVFTMEILPLKELVMRHVQEHMSGYDDKVDKLPTDLLKKLPQEPGSHVAAILKERTVSSTQNLNK